MYLLIGLISGFAAVSNFFGIVLPCCCLKLSNLYDVPELERLSKLRVKQSQKEEPFVEKVYQVPQEFLRDTIIESSAPIAKNQKKEYDKILKFIIKLITIMIMIMIMKMILI